MRWSKTFIPTLREAPAEAAGEGRRWLVRAGFVRERGGARVWLPLGAKALARMESAARRALERLGGEEMRAGSARDLIAAAEELRSYRHLPRLWYAREGGAVRGFAAGGDRPPVREIVAGWGVPASVAAAGAGEEVVAPCDGGRELLRCQNCGSLSTAETAASVAGLAAVADPAGDLDPEPFHTPGRKTIADIAAFTGLPASSQMKSVVVVADGQTILALVRGDHQLSERKLREALGAAELRAARGDEILAGFGAQAGSLGPVGARVRVVMDRTLAGRGNLICGANRDDYHLRNVTPGEDFDAEVADIRAAADGEACPACRGPLAAARGTTIGLSSPAGGSPVRVTDADGREFAPPAWTFDLLAENALVAAAALCNDKDGMILPFGVTPVDVVITPVSADAAQMAAAERVYNECVAAGLECLLDDRDERPGVKFKDSDLIGAPFRITVGKKLPAGLVELVARRGRVAEDIAVDAAPRAVRERL